MKIAKCPECGGEIQATVKVYLSDVVLKDGEIFSYEIDPTHATSRTSAIQEMIDSADGEELTIYCANDCDVDFTSVPDEPLDEAERQHRTDQDAGLEDRGDTGLEGGYAQ